MKKLETILQIKKLDMLTWLPRAIPLKAADSIFEPNSQSPQIPALPWGSKMHGMPGVFVGSAAPLHRNVKKIY